MAGFALPDHPIIRGIHSGGASPPLLLCSGGSCFIAGWRRFDSPPAVSPASPRPVSGFRLGAGSLAPLPTGIGGRCVSAPGIPNVDVPRTGRTSVNAPRSRWAVWQGGVGLVENGCPTRKPNGQPARPLPPSSAATANPTHRQRCPACLRRAASFVGRAPPALDAGRQPRTMARLDVGPSTIRSPASPIRCQRRIFRVWPSRRRWIDERAKKPAFAPEFQKGPNFGWYRVFCDLCAKMPVLFRRQLFIISILHHGNSTIW